MTRPGRAGEILIVMTTVTGESAGSSGCRAPGDSDNSDNSQLSWIDQICIPHDALMCIYRYFNIEQKASEAGQTIWTTTTLFLCVELLVEQYTVYTVLSDDRVIKVG